MCGLCYCSLALRRCSAGCAAWAVGPRIPTLSLSSCRHFLVGVSDATHPTIDAIILTKDSLLHAKETSTRSGSYGAQVSSDARKNVSHCRDRSSATNSCGCAQVMQPILSAAKAIGETWALPAVFELRKQTDDWADEHSKAKSYNTKLNHGLDMDFDLLDRFKERFNLRRAVIADDGYWSEIEGKMQIYPEDAPCFRDIACFLCQAPPEHIRLVICGVLRHRCVLKGAVHASNVGFGEIIVVDELVRLPVPVCSLLDIPCCPPSPIASAVPGLRR